MIVQIVSEQYFIFSNRTSHGTTTSTPSGGGSSNVSGGNWVQF